MLNSRISWTKHTWNPWTGCEPVSAGCRYCYAKATAERLGPPSFPRGFDFTPRSHKMRQPIGVRQPAMFFVNSMSDFFWREVPDALRDQALEVMAACPRHVFQVLTKRADEAVRYCAARRLPPNVWWGVTVESPAYYDRIETLRTLRDRAAVLFVSAEPMLAPMPDLPLAGMDWVIVGGESGGHLRNPEIRAARGLAEPVREGPRETWRARADRAEWVRQVRDRCAGAGAAFFFKQWGGPRHDSAGAELDGRTVHAFPPVSLPGEAGTLFDATARPSA